MRPWISSAVADGTVFACVTPPTRVRTNSPSRSRTRDSGAGGGRSNKERQRLQPLASVARAPLFEVRGVRFTLTPRAYTSITPGFLDQCLNVCSPCQVLGDVYTEVLEAAHPLHRGPTDHKRGVGPLLSLPEVHDQLFLLTFRERQLSWHHDVSLSTSSKYAVSSLLVNHSIISKFDNRSGAVRGVMITYNIYIVIRETGQFSSKGIINDFIGNLNRLTVSRRFTEQAV